MSLTASACTACMVLQLKDPAAHVEHAVLPGSLYCPLAHMVHVELLPAPSAAENVSGGHCRQVELSRAPGTVE